MDIDKIMKDICDDLEKNAMPFESWVYEVKTTHQIIREHLTKFNNVDLGSVVGQSEQLPKHCPEIFDMNKGCPKGTGCRYPNCYNV